MSIGIDRGLKSALGAYATRHEWRLPGIFQDVSPQAPSGGCEPLYPTRLKLVSVSDR